MRRKTATAHITFTYDPAEGDDLDLLAQELAENCTLWSDVEIETVDVTPEGQGGKL